MKKNLLLWVSGLLISTNLLAQRVDLDRFYVDVMYQKLPLEPVTQDQRSYGIHVKTGGAVLSYASAESLYDRVVLHGWKRVEQTPTVGIDLKLEDFTELGSSVETRVVETKDLSGKVTSTKVTYYALARYASRGNAQISGPRAPVVPTAKELEQQAKKAEAISTNRFLKNVAVPKTDIAQPTGPVVLSFSKNIEYKSQDYADSKEAGLAFSNNKAAIYSQQLRQFVDDAINTTNDRVNELYGFEPVTTKELFWILDSKSEEGSVQKEAIYAVKTLFATTRPAEPITELKESIKPLIEYFDSLKAKYPSDDKAGRKMRYSCFYNLAKIYLLTDEPEKAVREAEGLIANDYDAKDGENIRLVSQQLLAEFERAKTRTCHNASLN